MAVNDLNIAIIAGRLVSDPESRRGGEVAAFTIASNRFYYKNSERQKETLFIDCSAFGYEAAAALRLKKGDPITAEGRLELNTWEQNGSPRSKVRMVANRVHSPALRKNASEYVREETPDEEPAVIQGRSFSSTGDDIPF